MHPQYNTSTLPGCDSPGERLKECSHCHRILGVSQFGPRRRSPDGLNYVCRDCRKLEMRSYMRYRVSKATPEQADQLMEMQGGVCAICGKEETRKHWLRGEPMTLALDHDHKTGEIRGLLCRKCNTLLGLVGDSIAVLQAAENYLANPPGRMLKYRQLRMELRQRRPTYQVRGRPDTLQKS